MQIQKNLLLHITTRFTFHIIHWLDQDSHIGTWNKHGPNIDIWMIHNEIFVQFLIPEQISNVFVAFALSDDLKRIRQI